MKKSKKSLKSFLSLNKELIIYLILVIISIIFIITGIKAGFYILAFLLGIGWSLFFFRKSINILEHFFVSPIIFSILLIVYTACVSFLTIPITEIIFWVFTAVSLIVFILFNVFKSINWKVNKWDYLVLIIYIAAFIAKIYPLRDFNVSPLHDPITHSYLAKTIVETGAIEYFYSPGLHIIAAFGEMSNSFDVVKQILFLSNFYCISLGTMAYLFIKHYLKNKRWGIFSILLFTIGYYPILFFFNAGKNALVMGLTALMFFAFAITLNIKERNKRLYIFNNLSLAGIFLIHYPTAVFACILAFAVFIVYFRELKWEGALNALGSIFGFAWIGTMYKYQLLSIELSVQEDSANFSYTAQSSDLWTNFIFYIKNIWGSISPVKNSLKEVPRTTWFGGLFFFIIDSFKKRKFKKEFLLLFTWMLIQFIVFGIITVLNISSLSIMFETFLLSLGMYMYIFTAYLIDKLYELLIYLFKKKKIINILVVTGVLVLTILGSINMYNKCYVEVKKADIVTDDDYDVFSWIDNNISDSSGILINAIGGEGLVFSSDSGGWLEIYTGNKISTPFYRYGEITTAENVDLYTAVSENLSDCTPRQELIDLGYEYYFDGSIHFYGPALASQEDLLNSGGFELIYSKGDAELYKIIGCN